MTAELSDVFVTKREGVLYVVNTLLATFPDCAGYALDLSGRFTALAEARTRPLDFAAANWLATALFVAKSYPNCLLIDVGSTTTDLVPVRDGEVGAQGRDDAERLIVEDQAVHLRERAEQPLTLDGGVREERRNLCKHLSWPRWALTLRSSSLPAVAGTRLRRAP